MIIGGIDEAGRGCICGGLFVAGVVGDEEFLRTFNPKDSKKLSEKKRESIYQLLLAQAISADDTQSTNISQQIHFHIVQKDAWEIDKYGLSWALKTAIEEILEKLGAFAKEFIIDGNSTFGARIPSCLDSEITLKTLIKGDDKNPVIACASILAKVSKDAQMSELDKLYPQYALGKHKGYATALHIQKIKENGYCPQHRKSFKISMQDSLF
ncbi:ribonuclease HII [Helicobacter sp. MIT 05-5293]|uniref:ribonuclease HII n=1 Tax=Helicobacter sp. MIT 05-5293 TaxID=1548149 RepID=UPI00051D88D8|nr:ribonuclease HII [Helicobacter sp. MIT 05-5293]TLD81955.1 ribonuclease HII [Helicobacter sp. MIT 05-5293]